MINAGEVTASVNEVAGMVEFQQASALATKRLLPQLQERISKISDLQQRLQAASRQAKLHAEHIRPAGGRGGHGAYPGDSIGELAPGSRMHGVPPLMQSALDFMVD
jgi:hypothetical protein